MNTDRIAGLAMLLFCTAYALLISDIRVLPFMKHAAFTPRTLPTLLAILGAVISLALIVQPTSQDNAIAANKLRWQTLGLLCIDLIFFAAAVRPLGFIITATLFLIVGFYTLGERRWRVMLAASLPIAFGFWFLMDRVLDITLRALPSILPVGIGG